MTRMVTLELSVDQKSELAALVAVVEERGEAAEEEAKRVCQIFEDLYAKQIERGIRTTYDDDHVAVRDVSEQTPVYTLDGIALYRLLVIFKQVADEERGKLVACKNTGPSMYAADVLSNIKRAGGGYGVYVDHLSPFARS